MDIKKINRNVLLFLLANIVVLTVKQNVFADALSDNPLLSSILYISIPLTALLFLRRKLRFMCILIPPVLFNLVWFEVAVLKPDSWAGVGIVFFGFPYAFVCVILAFIALFFHILDNKKD